MQRAHQLTDQVDSVPFNPALWTRIESEINLEEKGIGAYLRNLFLLRWRPIAATVGAGVIASILFISYPITSTSPELEKEFAEFIQEREKVSRENARILFEARSNRDRRGGNPFVRPVSYEQKNPFRE
jgi:hypothetical protein